MSAYIYGNIEIQDPTLYEQYRAVVPAMIAAHGGRYLVRGGAVERWRCLKAMVRPCVR
jgi:uncharacterized protein (DUF1330 family)